MRQRGFAVKRSEPIANGVPKEDSEQDPGRLGSEGQGHNQSFLIFVTPRFALRCAMFKSMPVSMAWPFSPVTCRQGFAVAYSIEALSVSMAK